MRNTTKYSIVLCVAIVLLFSACRTTKMTMYVNRQYHDLMIAQRHPKESCYHGCERGLLLFRNHEIADTDSILIMKYDRTHRRRLDFIPGISPGEDYERFEEMKVIRYGGGSFFTVRARNSGNANGNAVRMYYIDEQDCTLHQVEVVRAAQLYSETLSDDFWIWNDETITYEDDSVTSVFFVWRQTDIHAVPTGGRVSVVYDMERIGERKYKLYPKEMNFTEGSFEL